MRKTSTTESWAPVERASEDCPWCRGHGMTSVPDMKMIEYLGTIYDIIKNGYISFIPRISVACPVCYPQGLRVSPRRVMTTLSMYSDKTYDCYPKEYWKLLGTVKYLDLKMEYGADYALSEVASRIRGFKEDCLLQSFLRESVSKHPINFKPKTFGKKDWNAIEAKREAAREAMARMMGESGK